MRAQNTKITTMFLFDNIYIAAATATIARGGCCQCRGWCSRRFTIGMHHANSLNKYSKPVKLFYGADVQFGFTFRSAIKYLAGARKSEFVLLQALSLAHTSRLTDDQNFCSHWLFFGIICTALLLPLPPLTTTTTLNRQASQPSQQLMRYALAHIHTHKENERISSMLSLPLSPPQPSSSSSPSLMLLLFIHGIYSDFYRLKNCVCAPLLVTTTETTERTESIYVCELSCRKFRCCYVRKKVFQTRVNAFFHSTEIQKP